ncbi:uncharacterized protein KRP23_4452 [Phytophthora ramorum]|uniref:uncharacterized protein n=1 Tax=Phytophthora ramorum TaxID=164328 RepID=UPI0030A1F6BA|nr:hypothetical protein KRP23_4452 [Phytophthora ramorum]
MPDSAISLPSTPPKCRPGLLRLMLVGSILYSLLVLLWVATSVHESSPESLPMSIVHLFTHHQHVATPEEDLFRYAWIKLDVPFSMIQTPPAVAGKVVNDSFCGMTMVQHDANGDVLFLHRNSNKLTGQLKREDINYAAEARKQARLKLLHRGLPPVLTDAAVQAELDLLMRTPPPTLEPPEPDNLPDPAMWTHLWSFRNSSQRIDYRIRSYKAEPDFPKWQRCYGQRYLSDNDHFYAQKIADTSFSGLETHLRRFAMEGAQLLEQRQASTKHRKLR